MNRELIVKTEAFLQETFTSSAHLQAHPADRDYRLEHSYRVANIAKSIAEQLQDRYMIIDEPPPVGKDCNDFLMRIRQRNRSRQMGAARYDYPR